MHGGDSLSLEKFCQKYQARFYSIYWKHRMRITGRRQKRGSSSPWNSSN